MKKIFNNTILLLSVLLVSVVAVPWNKIEQWGFAVPFLTDNEPIIKGGIGALVLVISIIFFFISNKEYKENGLVTNSTRNTAVLPIFGYSLAIMSFTTYLAYSVYMNIYRSTAQLLIFVGSIGVILTLFFLGYLLISEYKKTSNVGRFFRTTFLLELAIGTAAISYWHLIYRVGNSYSNISTKYMILMVPIFVLMYLLYVFISARRLKNQTEAEALENDFGRPKKETALRTLEDGKKTMIVPKEQNISSVKEDVDPTNIVFGDVEVDPEFSKVSNQTNQANSIEYYIEKPKMFKPLDPSFDELVSYVRELPQVVTKLEEDRITFYVDRKPFLVLMNFGNYYRMAFKYDLEQGIRLIIKYPTISKNKSTKDELWFKANNYGDIPKEVIYSIVKTAHSNYNN